MVIPTPPINPVDPTPGPKPTPDNPIVNPDDPTPPAPLPKPTTPEISDDCPPGHKKVCMCLPVDPLTGEAQQISHVAPCVKDSSADQKDAQEKEEHAAKAKAISAAIENSHVPNEVKAMAKIEEEEAVEEANKAKEKAASSTTKKPEVPVTPATQAAAAAGLDLSGVVAGAVATNASNKNNDSKVQAPVDPTTGKTASVEQTVGPIKKEDVKKFETDSKAKKDAALDHLKVEPKKEKLKTKPDQGVKGTKEYQKLEAEVEAAKKGVKNGTEEIKKVYKELDEAQRKHDKLKAQYKQLKKIHKKEEKDMKELKKG